MLIRGGFLGYGKIGRHDFILLQIIKGDCFFIFLFRIIMIERNIKYNSY